jgi:MOSC domain-containing protein YiiM
MSRDETSDRMPNWSGTVRALYIAQMAGAPMLSVTQANLVMGRGLQGDRYYSGTGTHSPDDDDEPWYEVTLIEYETIEALCREKQIDLDAGAPRRNIVTQGFALNHLVHRRFRIGDAILCGRALREPCPHLAETIGHTLMIGLIHRAGLGAQILRSGLIRVGDVIEEVHLEEGKPSVSVRERANGD